MGKKIMKNLLIDEPPILVSPTLATLIGLNEAIFLLQLNNSKNEWIEKDGFKWVNRSYQEWHENIFPFWSIETIRRIISKLEQGKLLISTQFDSMDRKKLYRINYEAFEY